MSPLRIELARRVGMTSIAVAIVCFVLATEPPAAVFARAVTQTLPASSAAMRSTTPAPENPRMTRVELTGSVTPEALMAERIDVIEVHRGNYCVILERPEDAAALKRLGAIATVIDEHPGWTAAERARRDLSSRPVAAGKRVASANDATGRFSVQTLPPLGSGSMAGHWTLAEVKMKLDDLVASDVNDVVADRIDTIGWTLQGRPIWGLRLTKGAPDVDNRPVAFYNALTHAREPLGMEALFYFVDDLLSNYGVDPTATHLLERRVIYIVPVVNPDGYRYNQALYDSTGVVGYHRKNLRDTNGNGASDFQSDGVDLNRNYSYQWGQPGAGSDPNDITYRGATAFSEPETQAQRDIVMALQPRAALSFHTYGDLLIHPWGYATTAAEDSLKFYEWSDDMALGSGYQSGQATRILYQVSGEFTDWCWGDDVTKPPFPAWTPEIGGPVDGFWPLPFRILPLARENLRACYYVASIAGPHVRLESSGLLEGALNQGGVAHLTIRARNRGTNGDAGPGLTATLTALSEGAHVIQGTASLPTLPPLQSGDLLPGTNFLVAADDTVTLGRTLSFQVDFSAPNGVFSRDTLDLMCGTPTVLLFDDGTNGLANWTASNGSAWGVQTDDAYHPGAFLSDSPETYETRTDAKLTAAAPLDLSRAKHAYLLFKTRWEFETDLDCGTVEANVSGNTWYPLPGTSTSLGISATDGKQPVGKPVYDGARRLWRSERVDLSSFAGPGQTAVKLRFRVQSWSAPVFDGFRLDDVQIVTFDPAAQPSPVAVDDGPVAGSLDLAPPAPNPARGVARLDFTLPRGGPVRLEVLDLQGRRVRSLVDRTLAAGRYGFGWDLRDAGGRSVAPGIYLVRLASDDRSVIRRVAVLH